MTAGRCSCHDKPPETGGGGARGARTGLLLAPVPVLRGPAPPPAFRPGALPETMVVPRLPPAPQLRPPVLGRSLPAGPLPRPPGIGIPHIGTGPLSLHPTPGTPVDLIAIPRCVPARPLAWPDFRGGNPSGNFAAETLVTTPTVTVQGNPMFQTQLGDRSAVRPHYRNPTDRARNGCAKTVADCEARIARHPDQGTKRVVGTECPAAPFTPAAATDRDECASVIGAACDADAVVESARLLAHEQRHFDIACVFANRANNALRAGTHDLATLRRWLDATIQPQQDKYDTDSHHGCDPAAQSTWDAAVAAGLPAVSLPTSSGKGQP